MHKGLSNEIRASLFELLYHIGRAKRLYRQSVMHVSPDVDTQAIAQMCEFADLATAQAHSMLEADSSPQSLVGGLPPAFISSALAEQIHARRALNMPRGRRPRPH